MEPLDKCEGGKLVENGVNGVIHMDKEEKIGPPDGGIRAWSVMIGSFLINGCLFGVINSFGSIIEPLTDNLIKEGYESPEALASLVGSLTFGITFLLSPISGMFTSAFGMRTTAFFGGFLAAAGLFISSFFLNNVYVLYFTYSFMYGCGASMAYTPSLAVLGHYFDKYLGLVNGIVSSGSSVFTILMPALLKKVIGNYGLFWAINTSALITFAIALCGLLFKPTPTMTSIPKTTKSCLKTFDIWRNKKYVIWALALPSALFGYFVPYVFIETYVKENFPDSNRTLAIQSIALTSGIGRLLFGFLADRPRVNRIMLQQLSFYVIGTLTMLLPVVNSFPLLIAVCLGMGLFDGAFISLLGPIAFDLVGEARAAQGIGCLLGLAATPISVGAPIASNIRIATGSFRLPFILAGVPPLVGASVMFLIHFVKTKPSKTEHANGTAKGKDSEESQPMARLNS